MNLLQDAWLPIVRRDRAREKIAIWQLLDDYETNPIVDLEAPRPDFRNAMYQLLIGIVQMAAMPEDDEQWEELWDKPWKPDVFKDKILKYEHCFNIDSDGPAFMQDFSLEEAKEEPLDNLFIDIPANGHYRKESPLKVDAYWAAVALYTLQTFAPSGGRGHRTGLRGGGPITTLLYPSELTATLHHKVWLNVLPLDEIENMPGNTATNIVEGSLPWMTPTKVSEQKGTELFPNECHPFHAYFGMPRRIRLIFSDEKAICELSNQETERVATGYFTRHSGNNYAGAWLHPLTAYTYDDKKPDEPPNPKKGSNDGILYRHWSGLSLKSSRTTPARVVELSRTSTERRRVLKNTNVILWHAGYDMDNMKARCWYEATMPIFQYEPSFGKQLSVFAEGLVDAALSTSKSLKSAIKSSWFSRPNDAKGDVNDAALEFWQITESDFYRVLQRYIEGIQSSTTKNGCVDTWEQILRRTSLNLFDTWALAQQEDGLDMKRTVKARISLQNDIGKIRKNLNALKVEEEQ